MFQIGDKVVRHKTEVSKEWLHACAMHNLRPCHIFTIKENKGGALIFTELHNTWDSDRFFKVETVESSPVTHPSHYDFFPGVEAIQIIAASLTQVEFKGYCMGNRLKYRLRAGKKDKLEQDIQKSDFYLELYSRHVHLCKVEKDA